MLSFRISITFYIVSVVSAQQVVEKDERPFLRILAPKFICNKKAIQTVQSNNVTIGLQTREGQILRYKIAIDFDMLGGEFKSQQHTLSIWKNIRLLQKRFNDLGEEISLKNQIEINAKELTPQVVYTFKVTGYDDKDRQSDVQNFTIIYKGGELKTQNSDIGDGVSLLLFSSEFLYDDMELLAVAEVSFCNPINDFFYQWKINGIESEEINSVNGNSIRIPSSLLQSGQQIEVIVAVLNNQSMTMSSATLPVIIMSKEFQLQITPSECSVGIQREILFQSVVFRQSGGFEERASEKWTCSETGKEECSASFLSSSLLMQTVMFNNEGNYELFSEVSFNDVGKSSISKVLVDPKVIPHVQIKFLPTQPINVNEANEIVVTVLNLIPKCIAYWNLMTEEGFAGFKEGVEGENFVNMGMLVIKDFEEHFLQELVDYDNNTLSKDIKLTLPDNIFIANEIYKFRLTVICPEPVDSTTQDSRNNVTSFYDVNFVTNAPPKTLPLNVSPLTGIPMRSSFKFLTGAAKDTSSDFPLKYTFGYVVNNLTVVIGTFYENTVATTQLPFSDAIETFYEVCDNNGACSKVYGEKIAAIDDFKYSTEEIEFKIEELEATLKRGEYSKSFNTAVVFLLTQPKFTDDGSNFESRMLEMLKIELGKLKSSTKTGYVHQQNVVEFIKMSKNLMGITQTTDETFVENLLSLTEIIEKQSRSRNKRTTFSDKYSHKTVVSHDKHYMKNVLELSEMLLISENASIVKREKMKYVKKVHDFISSLCNDRNLNSITISSKFVSFEVSKVFSPQLFVDPQTFPGEEKSTIVFASNANFPAKYICIGKTKFFGDVFDVAIKLRQSKPVFEAIVAEKSENGISKAIFGKDFSEFVTVELAGDATQTCEVFRENQWMEDCERLKANETRIACKCRTSDSEGIIVRAVKVEAKQTSSSEENRTVKPVTSFTFLSTRTTQKLQLTTQKAETTESVQITQGTLKTEEVSGVTVESSTQGIQASTLVFMDSSDSETVTSNTEFATVIKRNIQVTSPSNNPDETRMTTLRNSIFQPTTSPGYPETSSKDSDVVTKHIASKITTAQTFEVKKNSPSANPTNPTSATTKMPQVLPDSGGKINEKSEIQDQNATKVSATLQPALVTSNSSQENETADYVAKGSSSSWSLIIIFLAFLAVIIALFTFHKCRQYANSNFNLPERNPSNSIKYAKYHDEFTMRG